MENDKVFPGLFYAKNVFAKVRYPRSVPDNEKSSLPFAIEFIHPGKKIELWDLNSFRPDFRDYEDILKKMSHKKGYEMIVLYETVKYTDKNAMIPRYAVVEGRSFVNVR